MLGIKSNRMPVKGVFADKLREQISDIRVKSDAEKKEIKEKESKK